jgi:peptidoglycan/LPS O-acetylase OafA/YrhL
VLRRRRSGDDTSARPGNASKGPTHAAKTGRHLDAIELIMQYELERRQKVMLRTSVTSPHRRHVFRSLSGPRMQRPEIPSLTGLRFCAAALVLWAHTVTGFFMPAGVPILGSPPTTGYLGMTLFFVLSGFVIHYNYGAAVGSLRARAVYSFAVARFARLYPLFFLCVAITVAMSRDPSPSLGVSLPFYVTMTHDWSPQVVGNVFLGDVFAPGSWSISAEVSLYLTYIAMARPIDRFLKSEKAVLFVIGALVAVVSLFYIGKAAGWWYPTMDFSYPSMDHWLLYRSPLCRISEFALGVLVAALYNARRELPLTARERALAAIAAGIGAVWAVALLVVGEIPATKNQVLLFQLSWGFAPSVAALMFYLARCKSRLSWFVENKTIILLGDASYSIYLLQWVFFSVLAAPGVAANVLLVPKIVLAWTMTVVLSLGCYRYFECPARSFIRRVMAPDRFSGLFVRKPSAARVPAE